MFSTSISPRRKTLKYYLIAELFFRICCKFEIFMVFFFFWGFAGILDDLEASKTILCTVLLSLIKSFTLKYTSLNFLGLALGHDE
jgi:hypothetical protein